MKIEYTLKSADRMLLRSLRLLGTSSYIVLKRVVSVMSSEEVGLDDIVRTLASAAPSGGLRITVNTVTVSSLGTSYSRHWVEKQLDTLVQLELVKESGSGLEATLQLPLMSSVLY